MIQIRLSGRDRQPGKVWPGSMRCPKEAKPKIASLKALNAKWDPYYGQTKDDASTNVF